MNKNIKKVIAIGAIGLVSTLGIAGCDSSNKTQNMIDAALQEQKVSYDDTISSLQTELKDARDTISNLRVTNAESEGNEAQIELLKTKITELESDLKIVETEKETFLEESKAIQEEYEQIKKELETETIKKVCADKIEKTLDTSLATTFDNRDLEKLYDGEIRFDGNDYDVEEKLIISDDLKVGLSSTHDEEFDENAYLVMEASGAIEYKFNFKDAINTIDVSDDEPLKIKFLGKDIEITKINSSGLTIREGNEKLLSTGDEFEYDGKNVKVILINNDKIAVEVDGEFATIEEGSSDTINGVDILVKELIASSKESFSDYATIVVGENVEKTIDVGEEYTEDEENWVWTIDTDGDDLLKSIGVKWDVRVDDLNDDYKPVAIGESIVLPENFIEISFKELINSDYKTVEADFYEFGDSDINTIRFTSDDEIFSFDDEWFDTVYFDGTNAYYKDGNSDNNNSVNLTNPLKIVNDDKEYTVEFDGTHVTISDLKITPNAAFEYLGIEEKDAEKTDVVFDTNEIGKEENSYFVADGMIIEDVEDNADKDKVVFRIPSDDVEAVICIN